MKVIPDETFRKVYSMVAAGDKVYYACRKAKVSRSAYYRWIERQPNVKDAQRGFAISALRCQLSNCDNVCENCPWEEANGISTEDAMKMALATLLDEKIFPEG